MAAAAAAAPVPVQLDEKYDPKFAFEIKTLNDEYTKVVMKNDGGAMDPGMLFNLFMIVITIMSANQDVYANAFEMSGLATKVQFEATLVGMAYQFTQMVVYGQDITTSHVAMLLGNNPLLVEPLRNQVDTVSEILRMTDAAQKRADADRRAAKVREVRASRRAAAAAQQTSDAIEPKPKSVLGKRKMIGGYFKQKTKIVLANVILSTFVLGGTVFAAMGGFSAITTTLQNALASTSAFAEQAHCLNIIGYSKNWLASSLTGGVKSCNTIFDENRAAVDFIDAQITRIYGAAIVAVGGFSWAAWGNIRNMVIKYIVDPIDHTLDYMYPPKEIDHAVIVKNFIDGLITTSAAASWQEEKEAAAARNPPTANKWASAEQMEPRPKLYFNFTERQFQAGAINIKNLQSVQIRIAAPDGSPPPADFPGPPAVPAAERGDAMQLSEEQQNQFYSIIQKLEQDDQKATAAASLPSVRTVAPGAAAQGQSAAPGQQQAPGQGGKKRRRTMKKKKHHRKNKTGKKKHHKKKHHKKHKKSHKKHHKKHGRKTRKH